MLGWFRSPKVVDGQTDFVTVDMKPADMIDQHHPSFGCEQAWFTVAVSRPNGPGVTKILLVEAKNAWAVQTIERIAVDGGRISRTCQVLAIHRDCSDVGIRSDLVEEISYVDFMIDIVDPDLLLEDPMTATGFRNSLNEEERAYASAKLASVPSRPVTPVRLVPRAPTLVPVHIPPAPVPAPDSEPARERLMSGLTGLGFKPAMARKFVDGLGERIHQPVEVLLREGIRKMTPAA